MSTVTSIEQQIDTLADALKAAARQQYADDPSHEDFYAWGYGLSEITDTLGSVCRKLSTQVSRYGDQRVLRDDEGRDPYERLAEMRELLDALYSALQLANSTARAYHSAASHIAVEVDPAAEVEQ